MIQRKKKFQLCMLLIAILIQLLSVNAFAKDIHISVDGKSYDGPAYIQRGTTYIPLRHFLTYLGGTVAWNPATKSAHAELSDKTLIAAPATNCLTVDDISIEIPLFIQQERIYIPLRTVVTLLGYSVSWNQNSYSIDIHSKGNQAHWNEKDLYWLSRIISAEARGETLTGQIAVGNVILNRVASADYPNTIYDVIFDRKDAVQFEPTANGTIYNPPTDSAIQAAKLAMQGVNIVDNCLFFFNPSLSQGSWIVNNRIYYKTIGCHQFYL